MPSIYNYVHQGKGKEQEQPKQSRKNEVRRASKVIIGECFLCNITNFIKKSSMNRLIDHIHQFVFLQEEAQQAILNLAKIEEVEKGHRILEADRTCKRMYFLAEGTVRTYFYQNGKDITYWIYPEGNSFTSWHSYHFQKPSSEYIEAIEKSTIISLTRSEWQDLYESFPKLERFMRITLEQQMALLDDFYKGYYFLSAKEKYDLLIESFPEILQRANLGYVASMLGMSQETLSRVRRKKM